MIALAWCMYMHCCMHRVPISQRGGEVVEPLVSEQWFVRAEPLAGPALAAVADGSIRIVPERFERTYNFWLENIKVSGSLMWRMGLSVKATEFRCWCAQMFCLLVTADCGGII